MQLLKVKSKMGDAKFLPNFSSEDPRYLGSTQIQISPAPASYFIAMASMNSL
jgi:hypothetical protein